MGLNHRVHLTTLALALMFGAPELAGQEPLGDPFWIQEYSQGSQHGPVVAAQDVGSFVVFWNSEGADGDGYGVRMRRFSKFGAPLTPELPVNQVTAGDQRWVDVDRGVGGTLVVVWSSSDATSSNIIVRFFAGDLTPLGDELQLTADRDDVFRTGPSVDALPDGRYAVSWRSSADDEDVRVAVFEQPAVPVVFEQEVSPTTPPAGGQSVALLADGGFAVLWGGKHDPNSLRSQGIVTDQVFMRLFDPAGNPTTPEFLISVVDKFDQWSYGPKLVSKAGETFRAVWAHQENLQDHRLYAAEVMPPGAVGPVQPLGVGDEGSITFDALDSGDFVVTAGTEGFRYDAEGTVRATFYPFLLENSTVAPLSGTTGELVVIKPVPKGPGNADLIAQLLSSRVFEDGFESGDTARWDDVISD